MLTLWVTLLIYHFGQAVPSAHPFIKVFNEEKVKSAENDNLFLCPMNVTDNINLTLWPSKGNEIIINGTSCMDYDELMRVKKRGNFLKCLTEVVNTTTHVLDILGIDGSIIDGTLLGWLRHNKGQIPWDVDADLTIMQSHCQNIFNKYNNITTIKHKNIASIISSHLPNDSYYRVAAIKYNVGSELKPDEWEGCNTTEIRFIHKYNDVTCHADVFQMLQSTDPSAPCHKCPVPINSTSAAICRSLKSDQCGLIDDILPMKWDTLSGVKVKVPSNPEALLKSHFGAVSLELLNLKPIPRNYLYKDYKLVVGQSILNDSAAAAAADSSKVMTSKAFDSNLVERSAFMSPLDKADDSVNVLSVSSPVLTTSVSRTNLTTLSVSQISSTSIGLVTLLSTAGILLLYLFMFKRRNRSLPSTPINKSSRIH